MKDRHTIAIEGRRRLMAARSKKSAGERDKRKEFTMMYQLFQQGIIPERLASMRMSEHSSVAM